LATFLATLLAALASLFSALLTALTLTARLFFAPARGLLSALLTATLVLLSIVWHFPFLLHVMFFEVDRFRIETFHACTVCIKPKQIS
jgi:hypothetical protein